MHLRLHFDADLMLFGIIRVRCRRCQRAQDSDGVRAGGTRASLAPAYGDATAYRSSPGNLLCFRKNSAIPKVGLDDPPAADQAANGQRLHTVALPPHSCRPANRRSPFSPGSGSPFACAWRLSVLAAVSPHRPRICRPSAVTSSFGLLTGSESAGRPPNGKG